MRSTDSVVAGSDMTPLKLDGCVGLSDSGSATTWRHVSDNNPSLGARL